MPFQHSTDTQASTSTSPHPSETRFAALRHLVGGTAMLAVRCRFRGREHVVYAKHEVQNFTGSIKDRMALEILEEGYRRDEIEPGYTIAEATSGNTGISFAAIGRALGHDVVIFMPDWMSRERTDLIKSLGARVVAVSSEQGGFLGCISRANALATECGNVFLPHQFESDSNVQAHYRTTGPEILAQLDSRGLAPTAFVAGVGTGGTVMGVGRFLREHVEGVSIHPLEPANSPTLRTGTKVGKHRIQGISDEFIPPIVHLDELDDIVDVWDGDAILMAQRLAAELALGVGISSGANLLGALKLAADARGEPVVATIFCDSNKKYLSTDLCKEERAKEGYLSTEVELLGCDVIPG